MTTLPEDELGAILAWCPDDELRVALTCRKLRDAVSSHYAHGRMGSQFKFRTTFASVAHSIHTLSWARKVGMPIDHKGLAVEVARSTDTLNWVLSAGMPIDTLVTQAAASALVPEAQACMCALLNPEGLDYLHAAWEGQMRALQWLYATKSPQSEEIYMYAAGGGQLGVLEWARDAGVPRGDDIWQGNATGSAAENGQLEALQWLVKEGFEWDARTIMAAAQGGHMVILEWLYANGAPCNYPIARGEAANQEVVDWLDAHYQ